MPGRARGAQRGETAGDLLTKRKPHPLILSLKKGEGETKMFVSGHSLSRSARCAAPVAAGSVGEGAGGWVNDRYDNHDAVACREISLCREKTPRRFAPPPSAVYHHFHKISYTLYDNYRKTSLKLHQYWNILSNS